MMAYGRRGSGATLPITSGQSTTMCARLANLLTARRITIHAALLAIILWSAYSVDLCTPGLRDRAGNIKGVDFVHFYTAGRLLRNGDADALYDPGAQAAYQKMLLPESTGVYFVSMYGPQVYGLFVPLAGLPYVWAAVIWALLNSAVYFACCYALWRKCPHLKPHLYLVLLLAAAYPGFFSLIAFGQSSALALALFTLAFFALQARRPFLAGLAIGSLIYKPQLGLAAGVIFVAAAEWKVVAGAMASAAAQVGLAWVGFGGEVMRRYGQMFLRLGSAQPFLEPKLYQMHSLRSFWMLLLPWRSVAMTAYVVTAGVILGLGVMCWRRASDLRLGYAVLLMCSVLVAPHLWIYDLVIMAPALLLLGDWALSHHEAEERFAPGILIYACYALPLLGPAAGIIRLQMSVISFAALVWVLWTVINESRKDALPPPQS
jgi:hypothetical protein